MSDAEFLGGSDPVSPNSVAFDYIKSPDFRTVWADGAIGGITPTGLIHFAIYAERPAIPRRQVFAVVEDGDGGQKLGVEFADKRIARDGIVREMPVDVILSVNVAEGLAQWLLQQVEAVRNAQKR